MLKSKQEIPCFYLTVKADVTGLVELRAKLNGTGDVKLSYNDFLLKAVATGLEKYPIMTGQLAGEEIWLAEAIGIGLAISVPDGLVAPIVKDVNKKDVRQIALDSQALIERARGNKLAPTDVEGGCITVSNLGAFGIDNFIPIVVPGQCSILGIGQITDTCVPNNGNIMVRKLMNMTLSVDHKVANGAYAAQFLDFVKKLLEDTATFDLKS
jgi:pyruvate dehydrogenase E2 component (dihydrolipoamide acetyltransferase)